MDTVHECDRQTDRIAITKTVQRRESRGKNRRTTFCRVPHFELTTKKWLDSFEKQKGRIDLKERDTQTDRVNDKK